MRLPFDLKLPVVVAPMFLISGPDLVVAACTSGVIGSFPTPNCRTTDDLDRWMAQIVDRLDAARLETPKKTIAPWAANLVTHSSNARLAADLAVVERRKPPIVITALGSPKPAMDVVKSYGGLVIADVVNIRLARKAAEAGVDGMACISAGAGGHTGHLSPFAFISAVREFYDGFIIVGGGISDGAGVAGAVAAGADLVYMGTRFLPSDESLASCAYKQMVVDAGADDLVVSAALTGAPASWLKQSLANCGLDPDNLAPAPIRKDYNPSAAAQQRWKDTWAAGQGLQTIRAIQPTAEIVDQLAEQFRQAILRFTENVAERD